MTKKETSLAFFERIMRRIFTEKTRVIDIGGGLRISRNRGDRFDENKAWLQALATKTNYQIMDPVPDYHPDIVGDIHAMPFPDNSLEAIICSSVLEHVENPILAAQELYRTLKPGGYCYVFVPFLFYYHPEPGYYQDYWRFTEDALRLIFKNFTTIEIAPVRGALETWFHLNPFTRRLEPLARLIDRLTGKVKTKQVSGYCVFLVK
jgi:SAM-dependent methyltransferase